MIPRRTPQFDNGGQRRLLFTHTSRVGTTKLITLVNLSAANVTKFSTSHQLSVYWVVQCVRPWLRIYWHDMLINRGFSCTTIKGKLRKFEKLRPPLGKEGGSFMVRMYIIMCAVGFGLLESTEILKMLPNERLDNSYKRSLWSEVATDFKENWLLVYKRFTSQ